MNWIVVWRRDGVLDRGIGGTHERRGRSKTGCSRFSMEPRRSCSTRRVIIRQWFWEPATNVDDVDRTTMLQSNDSVQGCHWIACTVHRAPHDNLAIWMTVLTNSFMPQRLLFVWDSFSTFPGISIVISSVVPLLWRSASIWQLLKVQIVFLWNHKNYDGPICPMVNNKADFYKAQMWCSLKFTTSPYDLTS